MNYKQSTIKLTVLIILIFLLCFFVNSCGTFHKKKVPMLNDISHIGNNYPKKPVIYMVYKRSLEEPDNYVRISQVENESISKIMESSNLFSEVLFDEFESEKADFTIEINAFQFTKNKQLNGLKAIIATMLLYTIPFSMEAVYTLKMRVIDKQGQVIEEFITEDGVKAWVGLLFIPFGSKRINYHYLFYNLLANSLVHLSKSNKYLNYLNK